MGVGFTPTGCRSRLARRYITIGATRGNGAHWTRRSGVDSALAHEARSVATRHEASTFPILDLTWLLVVAYFTFYDIQNIGDN